MHMFVITHNVKYVNSYKHTTTIIYIHRMWPFIIPRGKVDHLENLQPAHFVHLYIHKYICICIWKYTNYLTQGFWTFKRNCYRDNKQIIRQQSYALPIVLTTLLRCFFPTMKPLPTGQHNFTHIHAFIVNHFHS